MPESDLRAQSAQQRPPAEAQANRIQDNGTVRMVGAVPLCICLLHAV